jgi:hypothetical protein
MSAELMGRSRPRISSSPRSITVTP